MILLDCKSICLLAKTNRSCKKKKHTSAVTPQHQARWQHQTANKPPQICTSTKPTTRTSGQKEIKMERMCRNMPFCGSARQGSRVRFPKEERCTESPPTFICEKRRKNRRKMVEKKNSKFGSCIYAWGSY